MPIEERDIGIGIQPAVSLLPMPPGDPRQISGFIGDGIGDAGIAYPIKRRRFHHHGKHIAVMHHTDIASSQAGIIKLPIHRGGAYDVTGCAAVLGLIKINKWWIVRHGTSRIGVELIAKESRTAVKLIPRGHGKHGLTGTCGIFDTVYPAVVGGVRRILPLVWRTRAAVHLISSLPGPLLQDNETRCSDDKFIVPLGK